MELAAIWNQVDKLIKKENELKSVVNRNICSECDGVKVIHQKDFRYVLHVVSLRTVLLTSLPNGRVV